MEGRWWEARGKDDSSERTPFGLQLLGRRRFIGELELQGDLSPTMRQAWCQVPAEAGAGSVFFHPREDDQGGRYDSVISS